MSWPRSRFPDRRLLAAAALAAGAVALIAGARSAAAQACCSGGALVTPTRLAVYEDYAVALQTRARTNFGSFGADGRYVSSSTAEQVLQQDLAAAVRLGNKLQVGALVPTVLTHRTQTGIDEWGGGVGDIALTARYDLSLASDHMRWPGFSVLVGVGIPTGTPPDRASNPLVTDATGTGTTDVTLGLAVEKVSGHAYGAINGWLTYRFSRMISPPGMDPFRQEYGLRGTLMAVGGWVFESRAALALYASLLEEGADTNGGVSNPAMRKRLTTAGAAGVLPLWDYWRAQGAVFSDVMLAPFGQNETVGVGLSASIVRVWM